MPLGGKLEITYACNLRCGFCYTDSPRRTLQRTPELSDSEWLSVADQLIEIGAIEAVVTGGEPLLRKDLTIEVCRRLADAGLGVTLNSNGWFIDDEVAARLAEAPGLHVHVSIDGPSPELHDVSRGVPGSWRRAIGALDSLIRHGVAVHVVHVVTSANVGHVEETLERLRELGVTAVRVTRVIEVGAAAREGGWRVAPGPLERAIANFRDRWGETVTVGLSSGEGSASLIHAGRAPAALLVRPDGAVRTDSLNPFAFGRVPGHDLATCWGRVREHWRDPEIARWQSSISTPADLPKAPLVAYLDDEVEVGPDPSRGAEPPDLSSRSAKLPAKVTGELAARHSVADPASHVRGLAFARRYRLAEVRTSGAAERRLVRRLGDGRVWRLNRAASIALDALAKGTPADVERDLRSAFPGAAAGRLRADALAVTQTLLRRRLIRPAESTAVTVTNPESTPDLPQVNPG